MMKRFLAFAGERYYPGGGWDDFRGSFDALEDAKAAVAPSPDDWGWWLQVVDTETGELHTRYYDGDSRCHETADGWDIEQPDETEA